MADAAAGQIDPPPLGGRGGPGAPIHIEPARHGLAADIERPGRYIELREDRDVAVAHQAVRIDANGRQHLDIAFGEVRTDHGRTVQAHRLGDGQPGRILVDPVAIAAIGRPEHQLRRRIENPHVARPVLQGAGRELQRPVAELGAEVALRLQAGDHLAGLVVTPAGADQKRVVEPRHQPQAGLIVELDRIGAIGRQGDHRVAIDRLLLSVDLEVGIGRSPQLFRGLHPCQHVL